MLAKILFITDFHKRYSDMKSIKGILPVQHAIEMEFVEFNKKNNITHNIITGDWYDRGFHGLGKAYAAMEEDRILSKSVDGRVYLCLGNHFYLERDENPEMYIIQPNEYIHPKDLLQVAEEPIFQVVPQLRIGDVLISFFHFSKTNKNYIAPRDPDIKFHIGVYHDDRCVPAWVREREGFSGSSSSLELNAMYQNIDLAIHGHIHSRIGITQFALSNGRKVPLWIPGAIGMTQNKSSIKHPSVDLPIIEINDDSTVNVMQYTFSTHLDELRFYNVSTKKLPTVDTESVADATTLAKVVPSLSSYLEARGFSSNQLALANAAMNGQVTVIDAVNIFAGGNNG